MTRWARIAIAGLVAVPAVLAVLAAGVAAPPTIAGPGLTVTVVDNTGTHASDQVFVFAQAGGTEVVAAPQPLSARDSFTVSSMRSGRVFVSLGAPLPAGGEPSPDTAAVRYDTVELTYPGVANLTAVDMFGIPLDLEVFDATGRLVGAKRWRCYTDVVRERLAAAVTAAGGTFARTVRTDPDGRFLRLVAPTIVSGLHPSGYPRFDSYLESLAGVPLRVRGRALGQTYDYTGRFLPDPGDPADPGTLRLVDSGPDNLKPMVVTAASLAGNTGNATNGIYGNNSPYLVGGEPHAGNDVYGAAYRDLVAGFAYGFWGSPAYGNDSALFDVATTPGPFAAAQPEAPHYNVWAATLWPLTDAYGFPYGDTFNHAADRNPIVELPPGGTLRITVQPDVSPASCRGGTGPSPTPKPSASPSPSPSPPSPMPSGGPTASPSPSRPRLVPPGRPGRPRISLDRRGSRVTLTWAPAAARGGGPPRYTVQARVAARCATVARTPRPGLRTSVPDSWRGRPVSVRVVARNAAGSSGVGPAARKVFPGERERRTGPADAPGSRPCRAAGW